MLSHAPAADTEDTQHRPSPPFSRAELDALGFARRGDDETALDAWWRLLNGQSAYDTPESAAARTAIEKDNKARKPKDRQPVGYGITQGSEAWNDAATVRIALHPIPDAAPPAQQDLFCTRPTDVTRYAIAQEDLVEPRAFGGLPPDYDDIANRYGFEETGLAIAWDEERILICCPRGACIIPRDRWVIGHRRCPAC